MTEPVIQWISTVRGWRLIMGEVPRSLAEVRIAGREMTHIEEFMTVFPGSERKTHIPFLHRVIKQPFYASTVSRG